MAKLDWTDATLYPRDVDAKTARPDLYKARLGDLELLAFRRGGEWLGTFAPFFTDQPLMLPDAADSEKAIERVTFMAREAVANVLPYLR